MSIAGKRGGRQGMSMQGVKVHRGVTALFDRTKNKRVNFLVYDQDTLDFGYPFIINVQLVTVLVEPPDKFTRLTIYQEIELGAEL